MSRGNSPSPSSGPDGGPARGGQLSRAARDIDPLTSRTELATIAGVGLLPTSERARVTTAWVLAVVSLALLATIPASLSGDVQARPGVLHSAGGVDWFAIAIVAVFALSGAALVRLRPGNAIGWLLLTCGLLQAVQTSCEAYGTRALTDPDGSLPLGLFVMWVATWTWLPALVLPVLVLPPLYPTGRPASRFWLWHVRLSLVAIGLLVVTAATADDLINDTVRSAQAPWDAPTWWGWVTGLSTATLLLTTTAVAMVGTVLRATKARGPERAQLVWLICVIGAMVATVFLPVDYLFGIAYGFVPVAVVVGVLRYRLLGIEVAVRRTLLYAPLTLLVALTVGGLTTALARLVPEGPLPLVLASAVVAVLVFPVAGRLRRMVDRFVLGERADPLTLVDRVGAGLEIATGDPVQSMLEAVAASAGATHAAVRDSHGRTLASVGEPVAGTRDFPLRHGGASFGSLSVSPRHGASTVNAADARLLDALAPHLAVVVRSRRLTEDLARERERVVAATLAERNRLRQDLHDGLGPALSGIALGIEAADQVLDRNQPAAHELLERTRAEAAAAVREIRRVIDNLRPSALDRHGLADAVRETAAGLGMGSPGGPDFALQVEDLPRLATTVEEAAFRIVAESLTNVVRHSGAHTCSVRLGRSADDLCVSIQDDGTGVRRPRLDGIGLESMRKRATDLGGRVEVELARPRGTLVTALLPLGSS
jgi:signal transduction histidine kinase